MPLSKSQWAVIEPELIKLDKDGFSFSEIANRLTIACETIITRCMVAGKLMRIKEKGLRPPRTKESTNKNLQLGQLKRITMPAQIYRLQPALSPGIVNMKLGRSIQPRFERSGECQWIMGNGSFCHDKCKGSYCEAHAAIVYLRA